MQKTLTLKQILMYSGNLSKAIEKAFLPELFYSSEIRSQDLYFHCASISFFWKCKWKNLTPPAYSGLNSKQWLESEDKDTYDPTYIPIFLDCSTVLPKKAFNETPHGSACPI